MIKIDRLMDDVEQMARIGGLENGGVQRPALSPSDRRAREFLISRLEAAGLQAWTDEAGNTFGRREADRPTDDDDAAVLAGSHIDTIERGGRFDGVVGVLGALESVRAIDDAGLELRRPIEVVAFNDEEERFLPFFGSRAFVGAVDVADVDGAADKDGVKLSDALRSIGCNPQAISTARRDPRCCAAFVELHIEQGPLLDRAGESIGIVERIKGDYRWEIAVTGRTDHAGAPKEGRADAFMALHTIIGGAREYYEQKGGGDATLTVGRFDLDPNIETAQPGTARCSVDFRSSDPKFLRGAEAELRALVQAVCPDGSPLNAVLRPILSENPVEFDAAIREAVKSSAERRRYAWRYLASGAGHDAQVLGRHLPSAMIFIPSVDGRSHCPEEFTRTEDIERGVTVLCDTLVWLAA